MVIDTSPRIAQMPIISLSGVDCLLGKGLRYVSCLISHNIYNVFESGVDLQAETLMGLGLLDELPTDWVKSDQLETLGGTLSAGEPVSPTDWVKSDQLETDSSKGRVKYIHYALPIGLNRISWKRSFGKQGFTFACPNPTDWVKSDQLET